MSVVSETIILGLKIYELITIVAIVVGPIVAVAITLFFEGRRQERDRQNQTMRMLVSTRHLPGDPAYTTAINMIPVDFNRQRAIMAAWHAYIDSIRFRPSAENEDESLKQAISKQTKLIFEIMNFLGYRISETDLQATPYAAGGFIERDNIMIRAWQAWTRIADALESQSESTPIADSAAEERI